MLFYSLLDSIDRFIRNKMIFIAGILSVYLFSLGMFNLEQPEIYENDDRNLKVFDNGKIFDVYKMKESVEKADNEIFIDIKNEKSNSIIKEEEYAIFDIKKKEENDNLSINDDQKYTDREEKYENEEKIKTTDIKQKPLYKKLIFVLIDGLRIDGLVSTTNDSFYHNNFKFTSSIPSDYKKTFLSVSGLPTGTIFRVKSILTGLPSNFLNITTAFNHQKIITDSFIKKLNLKKTFFYGDSTWTDLFPELKNNSLTYNAYDKMRPLNEELNMIQKIIDNSSNYDYNLIHLLYLDHYGHLYGTQHDKITYIMRKYDTMVRDLYDKMDDDTLLVLYSDHGVNDDGSHGGASVKEMSSVCMFLSKKKMYFKTDSEMDNIRRSYVSRNYSLDFKWIGSKEEFFVMHQEDVMPTVCGMIGVSFPEYTSGNVVFEFFKDDLVHKKLLMQKLHVLLRNSRNKRVFFSRFKMKLLFFFDSFFYSCPKTIKRVYQKFSCKINFSMFQSFFKNSLEKYIASLYRITAVKCMERNEFFLLKNVFIGISAKIKHHRISLSKFLSNKFINVSGIFKNFQKTQKILLKINNKEQSTSSILGSDRYLKEFTLDAIKSSNIKEIHKMNYCLTKEIYKRFLGKKKIYLATSFLLQITILIHLAVKYIKDLQKNNLKTKNDSKENQIKPEIIIKEDTLFKKMIKLINKNCRLTKNDSKENQIKPEIIIKEDTLFKKMIKFINKNCRLNYKFVKYKMGQNIHIMISIFFTIMIGHSVHSFLHEDTLWSLLAVLGEPSLEMFLVLMVFSFIGRSPQHEQDRIIRFSKIVNFSGCNKSIFMILAFFLLSRFIRLRKTKLFDNKSVIPHKNDRNKPKDSINKKRTSALEKCDHDKFSYEEQLNSIIIKDSVKLDQKIDSTMNDEQMKHIKAIKIYINRIKLFLHFIKPSFQTTLSIICTLTKQKNKKLGTTLSKHLLYTFPTLQSLTTLIYPPLTTLYLTILQKTTIKNKPTLYALLNTTLFSINMNHTFSSIDYEIVFLFSEKMDAIGGCLLLIFYMFYPLVLLLNKGSDYVIFWLVTFNVVVANSVALWFGNDWLLDLFFGGRCVFVNGYYFVVCLWFLIVYK